MHLNSLMSWQFMLMWFIYLFYSIFIRKKASNYLKQNGKITISMLSKYLVS